MALKITLSINTKSLLCVNREIYVDWSYTKLKKLEKEEPRIKRAHFLWRIETWWILEIHHHRKKTRPKSNNRTFDWINALADLRLLWWIEMPCGVYLERLDSIKVCVISAPPHSSFSLALIFLPHLQPPPCHRQLSLHSFRCQPATKNWNKLLSVIIWKLCQFHVFIKKQRWI